VAFTAPSSNGGANITNYEFSINGGTNWTTPSPALTSSPLLITGLTNGTTYDVQIRAVNSAGSGTVTGTTQGTPLAPASPTITVAPATFASSLSTTYGTASSTANFTVSGSTLSGDLTVTAPSGLEVSLSIGSGFADSLNLTATSNSVASTTIYARLKSTAAAGSYNDQNISVSGGGATTQNVATSASGNTVGQKELTVTGLTFQDKVYDRTTTASATGTAALSGVVGSDDVTLGGTPSYSFATATVGNSKAVSTTGYSLSGAASGNYSLTQASGTASITALGLTVTGATATDRAFNATTTVAITGGLLSGVISPDAVTLGGTPTGAMANANVGDAKAVTVTGYSISGTDSGNYSISQPTNVTVNITKTSQTISGVSATTNQVVGATYALGATVASGLTLSYSSSNTGVATVNASGNVTVVGAGTATLTVSQAGDSNYNAATDVVQVLTATLPPIWTNPITGTNPNTSNPYTTGDVKNSNINAN
jgi:hypothetical protein